LVPPQPRLPLRRPSGARRTLGPTIAIVALAAVSVVALGPACRRS
jgi:hypothetical protein